MLLRVDPNMITKEDKVPPLLFAASGGALDLLQLFGDQERTDWSAQGYGFTFLHCLLDLPESDTNSEAIARENSKKCMEWVLEKGIDLRRILNMRNDAGWTALGLAVKSDWGDELISSLLGKGAKITDLEPNVIEAFLDRC